MAAKKGNRIRELLSRSPEETRRLGMELAESLPIPGVMLLRGSLGTGKTTLARGVAEGLGLSDGSQVNSPSFTIVNIYQGRCPIYHVDLYRLSGERDIRSVGLDEFLGRDGVTLVEWSERLPYSPDFALEVELEDDGDDRRRVRICYPSGSGAHRRLPTGKRNRTRQSGWKKQK
jgi:tRNA threonylcarbamoyladenosine biosynthesis protein TsaE